MKMLRIDSILNFFICYAHHSRKMISKDISTIYLHVSMIKSTTVNDLSWMWTISEVKSHLKFVNGNIIVAFNFMEMTDGCFISKIESVMKFRCENLCFITASQKFSSAFCNLMCILTFFSNHLCLIR